MYASDMYDLNQTECVERRLSSPKRRHCWFFCMAWAKGDQCGQTASIFCMFCCMHVMLVFFSLLAVMTQAHIAKTSGHAQMLLRCDFDSLPKTTPERSLSRMSDYDETSTSVNLQKAACNINSITGCSSHCHSFSVFVCTWGQSKAAGMMSSAKSFQYLQAGNCSNQT